MTDRELLEMAAKASGYTFRGGETFGKPTIAQLTYIAGDGPGAWELWNPLTDDGDALRLAVKLRMHCVEAFPVPSMALILECGGDEYAATRRAIVRAAAEIGRAM